MKELTIKEKARAYDRIVEKAKVEKEKSRNLGLLEFIDKNFPELKESEDKVREELISLFQDGIDGVNHRYNGSDCRRWLAWLEKQGEKNINNSIWHKVEPKEYVLEKTLIYKKNGEIDIVEDTILSAVDAEYALPISYLGKPESIEKQGEQKSADKVEPKFKVGDKIRRKNPSSFDKDMQVARIEKDYYICNHIGKFSSEVVPFSEEYCYDLIEQKPADKVEPKFKVGDWVVSPNGVYWHVDAIRNSRYQVSSNSGECTDWSLDTNIYHKFTIQDAKDGDVLADGNLPFIFKKIDDNKYSYAYCGISVDDVFKIESEGEFGEWTWRQDIKPATKEQRDFLFQKMKEAGYEWDAEKKELKIIDWSKHIKYEPNSPSITKEYPTWSEEDEEMLEDVRFNFEYNKEKMTDALIAQYNRFFDKIKSLKPQPKQEWGEEDETYSDHIITAIKSYYTDDKGKENPWREELLRWLNALRPQNTWMPSDEQMKQLGWIAKQNKDNIIGKELMTLYKDLKKIREEYV